MKSVYVLCRGEGFDHPLRRKSRGQWELHEDAMDTGVLVEDSDAPEERRFIRFSRQFDMLRIQPRFAACFHLVPHIDSRSRVVPDLQHRETGTHTHRRKGGDTSNQPYAQVSHSRPYLRAERETSCPRCLNSPPPTTPTRRKRRNGSMRSRPFSNARVLSAPITCWRSSSTRHAVRGPTFPSRSIRPTSTRSRRTWRSVRPGIMPWRNAFARSAAGMRW